LIVVDKKNKSVYDKQAQTHHVIAVMQQRIIGNAVRLITVLLNLMVVKAAIRTLAVKLKTHTSNRPVWLPNRRLPKPKLGRQLFCVVVTCWWIG